MLPWKQKPDRKLSYNNLQYPNPKYDNLQTPDRKSSQERQFTAETDLKRVMDKVCEREYSKMQVNDDGGGEACVAGYDSIEQQRR